MVSGRLSEGVVNERPIRNMGAEDLKKSFVSMCKVVEGKFSTKGAYSYSCRFGNKLEHRIQLLGSKLEYSIFRDDGEQVLLSGVPVRTIEAGNTVFGYRIHFKAFPHTRDISIVRKYDGGSVEVNDRTIAVLGSHSGMNKELQELEISKELAKKIVEEEAVG